MNDIDLKERNRIETEVKRKVGSEARKQWDVLVDVYLHSETPGDFTIESYLQSDPDSDNLIFYNNGHPGFHISFSLHDETGLGYSFPQGSNKEDAVWSQVGENLCPETGVWGVFEQSSIVVKNSGATLEVHNPNPSPAQGQFSYTLNVSKDGGATYLALDPGGINQNGGTSRSRR